VYYVRITRSVYIALLLSDSESSAQALKPQHRIAHSSSIAPHIYPLATQHHGNAYSSLDAVIRPAAVILRRCSFLCGWYQSPRCTPRVYSACRHHLTACHTTRTEPSRHQHIIPNLLASVLSHAGAPCTWSHRRVLSIASARLPLPSHVRLELRQQTPHPLTPISSKEARPGSAQCLLQPTTLETFCRAVESDLSPTNSAADTTPRLHSALPPFHVVSGI
jgi:hypothetical protein